MKLDKRQVAMWFSLGLVAGALLMGVAGRTHWGHRKRSHNPERIIQRFSKGLDLSSEQHGKLRAIILTNHPKFKSLYKESRAKKRELSKTVRLQIREILDPKQQAAFDNRNAERKER